MMQCDLPCFLVAKMVTKTFLGNSWACIPIYSSYLARPPKFIMILTSRLCCNLI